MIETAITTLLTDPFKAILGSGGVLGAVVLVVRWWRSRPAVRIHSVREVFDTRQQPMIEVVVTAELENIGREATSMNPAVALRYISSEREVCRYQLSVQETDRTLFPVTPKSLTLKAEIPAGYVFSHFRVLTFSFTRGASVRSRTLNASGENTDLFKFKVLEWLFRVFGALPHIPG